MPAAKKTTTTTTTTTRTTTTRPTSTAAVSINPHYRFNTWVALMVLSLVALVSIVAVTDHKSERDFKERWSLACSGISMCLAFFGSIGHAVFAVREKFVSTLVEFIMAAICVACWIFSIPMITATDDDSLAVNHNFQISDANLYFASWGAFCFSLLLFSSVGNERGIGAPGNRDGVARRWLWLIIACLIILAASSRMFDSVCDNNTFQTDGEFCRELKLGISLGVIGMVIAAIMTLLMWFKPDLQMLGWIGAFCALCMLVISGVLVAYLTFDQGPASTVGNLFFSVWMSAIISLDLAVCYFMGWLRL